MEQIEYQIMSDVEDFHWWYLGLRRLSMQMWHRHVPDEATRLLDVGCGTGAFLASLDVKVTSFGIDMSPHAIGFCQRRNLQRLTCASALALPFPEAQFDVVTLMDVLYHREVSDPVIALRESHRALRANGTIMLNVPAYNWLRSSHDRSIHTERRFTRTQVLRMLSSAGFDILEATYWNCALMPLVVPYRLYRKLRPCEHSDLERPPGKLSSFILGSAIGAERCMLRAVHMPFGLSIFAVARKGRG